MAIRKSEPLQDRGGTCVSQILQRKLLQGDAHQSPSALDSAGWGHWARQNSVAKTQGCGSLKNWKWLREAGIVNVESFWVPYSQPRSWNSADNCPVFYLEWGGIALSCSPRRKLGPLLCAITRLSWPHQFQGTQLCLSSSKVFGVGVYLPITAHLDEDQISEAPPPAPRPY